MLIVNSENNNRKLFNNNNSKFVELDKQVMTDDLILIRIREKTSSKTTKQKAFKIGMDRCIGR
jgi:hypothetical protein